MNKIRIGIDNGVTGSIGIIGGEQPLMFKTPIVTQQSYTKKKQKITRIDFAEMQDILSGFDKRNVLVILERPFLNPQGLKASISAARCLEAQLNVIELLEYPYIYIDSKEWQKELLPKGMKGKELKKASLDIGIRLFPLEKESIEKHKDADGLLIAEYARRKNL